MNNSKNCLSCFHLNLCSLTFPIEELTTLISEHNLTFDISEESETKLRLNKAPINSVTTSNLLRMNKVTVVQQHT